MYQIGLDTNVKTMSLSCTTAELVPIVYQLRAYTTTNNFEVLQFKHSSRTSSIRRRYILYFSRQWSWRGL